MCCGYSIRVLGKIFFTKTPLILPNPLQAQNDQEEKKITQTNVTTTNPSKSSIPLVPSSAYVLISDSLLLAGYALLNNYYSLIIAVVLLLGLVVVFVLVLVLAVYSF